MNFGKNLNLKKRFGVGGEVGMGGGQGQQGCGGAVC